MGGVRVGGGGRSEDGKSEGGVRVGGGRGEGERMGGG